MFDLRELQQLFRFMQNCTLQGNESISHATLLVKIQKLINQEASKNS